MKKTIITILLCSIILGEAKNSEKDLQETQQKNGWVEKENVNTIMAKFNAEIMARGLNTPVSDDYMITENDLYWFALADNISYYLKPVEFSGNKKMIFLI